MESENQFHVAMFPWLAFGHLIPFLELSKLIAQKGHKISYISTPRNISRLPKIPSNLSPLINFISLSLPPQDNLPQSAEATTDIPDNIVPYLKKAFDGLENGVSNFLEVSSPNWIISDFAPHWLPPIASRLGISLALFSIYPPSSLCFVGPTSLLINGDESRTKPEHFTVSPKWVPFKTNVVYRHHEAKSIPDLVEVNVSSVTDVFRLGSLILGCDVLVLRSCLELQPEWFKLLGELHKIPILPLGLLPPSIYLPPQETNEAKDIWVTISEWLDKQEKKSVVYIALGTEVTLTQNQLTELAFGLMTSMLPFFWVYRKVNHTNIELPEGFEERIKGRGMVWKSWAPQLKILGHESVGGFLTHCGWSSVIEALHFGCPLVMLPFWADTGLIARIFEEKEVGVEVPRNEEDGTFTRESLALALRRVVVDNKGQIYRDKAKEMMKLFSDKEIHGQYVNNFIEYLQNFKSFGDSSRSQIGD